MIADMSTSSAATSPTFPMSSSPSPAPFAGQVLLLEDDPAIGDGAYSSAGAFGFYPWIDASRTWYGIVARAAVDDNGMGFASAQCGRLIRKAWVVGLAQ